MQHVDDFYTKLKMLRTKGTGWSNSHYNREMFEKLAEAFVSRWNVVGAEESLRDALGACGLGTQLSQSTLQQLKARALHLPYPIGR